MLLAQRQRSKFASVDDDDGRLATEDWTQMLKRHCLAAWSLAMRRLWLKLSHD
jgi:hypothetical protein